jgi:biotin transport system substrate-specific component
MAVATTVIYAFGVAGLVLVSGMSLPQAVTAGVLPFLAVDAIKAVLAAVLLPAAWAVAGHPGDTHLR